MFDWQSILKNVAPAIGGVLGAIVPGAQPFMGIARSVLTSVFGLSEDATDEDIYNNIKKATPEQLLMLKKEDYRFSVEMKKLDVDVYKMEVDDRKDARQEASKQTFKMTNIVAFLMFCIVIVMIVALFNFHLTSGFVQDAYMFICGFIFKGLAEVIDFYFGSSSGSKIKDVKQ